MKQEANGSPRCLGFGQRESGCWVESHLNQVNGDKYDQVLDSQHVIKSSLPIAPAAGSCHIGTHFPLGPLESLLLNRSSVCSRLVIGRPSSQENIGTVFCCMAFGAAGETDGASVLIIDSSQPTFLTLLGSLYVIRKVVMSCECIYHPQMSLLKPHV